MSRGGPQTVLGIDPGSRVTGWGLIRRDEKGGLSALAWGTLRVGTCASHAPLKACDEDAAVAPIAARLAAIHSGISALIGEHAPDAVGIEEAFVGRNVRSAIRLAEARAVCLLAAELAGRPLHEVPPALVKKSVTGHGRASKEAVREAVMRTLRWPAEERAPAYDASDALAIGLCVLNRLSAPAALLQRPVGRRARRRRWTLADVEDHRHPKGSP